MRKLITHCSDLYEDDPLDHVARNVLWGTRGKDGNKPLKWIKLWDAEDDHLAAILATQPQVKGTIYEKVIRYIQSNRSGGACR